MRSSSLLVLLSALAVATAGPVRRRQCGGRGDPTPTSVGASPSVTPVLPTVSGAATQLPEPTGLSLKYIAVGHGIQNYSCSAATVNATGASAGALAVLYDVTSLYPGMSASSLSQDAWDGLSKQVLYNSDIPLNLVPTSSEPDAASTTNPFPSPAALRIGGMTLPFLAHHYFDTGLNPTFDLSGSSGKEFITAAKKNSVSAPSTADAGPMGTGAVAWLQLTPKDSTNPTGVQWVYRVLTDGGNSIKCPSATEFISVPYAALYWFYD